MSDTNFNGGIGFVGTLTVAFIVLKLIGEISWPWIWVISPLWISACIVIVLLAIFLLALLIRESL